MQKYPLLIHQFFLFLFLIKYINTKVILDDELPEEETQDFPNQNTKTIHLNIACIGDSITRGTGSSDAKKYSYPSILQSYMNIGQDLHLLSSSYSISNFGVPGATASNHNIKSYRNTTSYNKAITSQANIFILSFGTNDAKDYNWNEKIFKNDYKQLIQYFIKLKHKPKVFLCIPPPIVYHGVYHIQQTVIEKKLSKIIIDIAKELHLNKNLINFYLIMRNKSYYFINESLPQINDIYSINMNNITFLNEVMHSNLRKIKKLPGRKSLNDGVHPNDLGYFTIAHTVAITLLGESIAKQIQSYLIKNNEVFNYLYKEGLMLEKLKKKSKTIDKKKRES